MDIVDVDEWKKRDMDKTYWWITSNEIELVSPLVTTRARWIKVDVLHRWDDEEVEERRWKKGGGRKEVEGRVNPVCVVKSRWIREEY